MLRGTTTPAIPFFLGKGFSVVSLDIASLGLTEPGVIAFKQRIEFSKIFYSNLGILQMGTPDVLKRI